MKDLLASHEESRQGLRLKLTVNGEMQPKIEEITKYSWEVKIIGNRQYPHIKELIVEVTFSPEEKKEEGGYFSIEESQPTNESEDIGTLSFGLAPLPISFSRQIKERYIQHEPLDGVGVKWIFSNIVFPKERFEGFVKGSVCVKFSSKSADNKFKINIDIYPKFLKRSYLPMAIRKKLNRVDTFELLNIKGRDLQEESKNIIPYDPQYGKPERDAPDRRVLKYIFDTKKCELYKGDVRNVSLRADTLSVLFKILAIKQENEDIEDIIRKAGRLIGKDFLFVYENRIKHGNEADSRELAYYDSTAGMGKFLIDIRKKRIEVENSFLACGINNIQSGKTACTFLEGYFEGILSILWNRDDLKVREKECVSKGDRTCKFEILEKAKCINELELLGKDKNIYKFMILKKEPGPGESQEHDPEEIE
jgi:predicted hydrocarbon binding protein